MECGLTLKRVRDMIITYRQINQIIFIIYFVSLVEGERLFET